MQVMKLYPYMQRFLDVAVKEEHTEAVERIAEKKLDYEDRLRAYSMQADYSNFCTIRGFCACDKNGALYDRRADR